MVVELTAQNAPEAYVEMIQRIKICGVEEESRLGPVLTCQDPVVLNITNPRQRVLFDPIRDANPFFHMAEFIWMMAAKSDIEWIEQFNSKFSEYATDGTVHGAYGYRWRRHFAVDQIKEVVAILADNPMSRRAVLGMWDPAADLDPGYADYPCNTHIYFRTVNDKLNMTVCNRSNDMIWGMLGANIVHMTMLHELIAHFAGIELGTYRVFTNNCHVYKSLPNYDQIMRTLMMYDPYGKACEETLLFAEHSSLDEFFIECRDFVSGDYKDIQNDWLMETARPACEYYLNKDARTSEQLNSISASDWRLACQQWAERRMLS